MRFQNHLNPKPSNILQGCFIKSLENVIYASIDLQFILNFMFLESSYFSIVCLDFSIAICKLLKCRHLYYNYDLREERGGPVVRFAYRKISER